MNGKGLDFHHKSLSTIGFVIKCTYDSNNNFKKDAAFQETPHHGRLPVLLLRSSSSCLKI